MQGRALLLSSLATLAPAELDSTPVSASTGRTQESDQSLYSVSCCSAIPSCLNSCCGCVECVNCDLQSQTSFPVVRLASFVMT